MGLTWTKFSIHNRYNELDIEKVALGYKRYIRVVCPCDSPLPTGWIGHCLQTPLQCHGRSEPPCTDVPIDAQMAAGNISQGCGCETFFFFSIQSAVLKYSEYLKECDQIFYDLLLFV